VSDTASDPGPEGLFADTRQEIAADDWEDQDLLTKDEARLRLRASAEMIEAELAGLGSDGEPGRTRELREQLDRITQVLRTLGG
jgi:hypothetical protein